MATLAACAAGASTLPAMQSAGATPTTRDMSVYLGTTHAHTGQNNHGVDDSTVEESFAAAKESGYDFFLVAEHSGETGPTDRPAFYADALAQADAASEAGDFVGLAGYEYSDNNSGSDDDPDRGHMTVYGTPTMIDAQAKGESFATLFDQFNDARQQSPFVFAGFNHPEGDHDAAATSYLDTSAKWRVALTETSNAIKYKPEEEAKFYQAYVTFLDRGWYVSPSCGTDTHGLAGIRKQESADDKPCRTGILAPALTQRGILWGILNRRTYSTRDTNLQIRYSLNGHWMGSRIDRPDTADLLIEVDDPDTDQPDDAITRIDVVGEGGEVIAARSFSSHSVRWTPSLPTGSQPYLFVRVYNGEREAHTAVTAPVWLR